MIEDGYPIADESWKPMKGAQAGALILDYEIINMPNYWACHCLACGNPYTEKRVDNLKIGAIGGRVYSSGRRCNGTRSCGCKQKKQFVNPNTTGIIYEDLTGQILNDWKLIQKTSMKDNNRSFMYLCQSTIHPQYYDILSIRHLKDGNVAKARLAKKEYNEVQLSILNPKPKMSGPEEKMLSVLQSLNLHGFYNIRFEKCKDKLPLPFDFIINGSNNKNWIIEVDGQQHFKPAWDGKEPLLVTHAHDLIKNKFCFDNNIPIIRIPDNVKYTEQDIFPETTAFLITKENEEKYYETKGTLYKILYQ